MSRINLKAMGITTADLLSYSEFRDMHIRAKAKDIDLFRNQVIANNTGLSRQVRRQHEREGEKVPLSATLVARLATLYPGQGLFMQRGRPRFAGWPNERRTPTRDYSKRYASLFPVLPNAPDVQGRNGEGLSTG